MSNFKISSLFDNKKFTTVLSILLAVVFWFVITLVENPESERVINGVPVYLDMKGTIVEEQGLSIISDTTAFENVSVKVTGRTSLVNSIKSEDLLVKPVLDGVNAAGKFTLKLEPTNNTNKGFVVESVTPESIDVEFDYIDTINFDVQIKVKNAVADKGLTLGAARFTNAEKMRLEVSGPRSVISKISTVAAVAYGNKSKKLSATESYDAEIKLYNAKNKEIKSDRLNLSFKTVSVSLPVLKSKMVPIRCTYTNKPDDFTPVATVVVNKKETSAIEIEGSPDIIDKTNFVELESVDFLTVSKTNNEFSKNIVLPSGVSLVSKDVESVKVKLDTKSLTTKTFKVATAVAINNKNNYNVKLTDPISVKICGDEKVIDALSSADLNAVIDLDGKELGEQTIPVTIKSTLKDNVWQYGTYDAKINIYK